MFFRHCAISVISQSATSGGSDGDISGGGVAVGSGVGVGVGDGVAVADGVGVGSAICFHRVVAVVGDQEDIELCAWMHS